MNGVFSLQAVPVLDLLERELGARPVAFEEILDALPLAARMDPTATDARLESVLQRQVPPDHRAVSVQLFAILQRDDAAARKQLEAAATGDPPVRHAAHALGVAALEADEFHAACDWFRREGRLADAHVSRAKAVECLLATDDFAGLQALTSEPGYEGLISPSIRLSAAIHARDWPAILRAVPIAQFTVLDPGNLVLALIAGFAWAFVLVHLGELPRAGWKLAALCGAAVVAGVISTTPTIYAVIWQDELLGFAPEGDFLRTLVFFIGGVGVREEFCKLLLFVPFIPWLVRRDSELDALIVASFVGLGFAMEENGNYFLESGGVAMAGRFLTANFLHIALTGMNGLALYRAFTRGGEGVNEFLTVFGGTIIAHGLYDALLSMPDAELGAYLSMAVYVLTCQAYFRRAHELRDHSPMLISLTGSFVAGVSVVAGTMVVVQMMRLGPTDGLLAVLPEFIGTIILLVMFVREFDEPLAA